jgi:hypothetical protein
MRRSQSPLKFSACNTKVDDIVVIGCKAGNSESMSCHSKGVAANVCVLLDFLKQYPLTLQDRFLVLRKSLLPRLVYLTRTGPVTSDGDIVDADVRSAANRILRAARDFIAEDFIAPPTTDNQLRLPLRLGGCGLRVPGAHGIEGCVSCLLSAALAQAAFNNGPTMLRPFDRPHRAALDATWQAARTAVPELWKPETQDLSEALTKRVLASAQHTFAFNRAQAVFLQLLQSLDSSSPDGQIALASVASFGLDRSPPGSPHRHPPQSRLPGIHATTPRPAPSTSRSAHHHLLLRHAPRCH